MKKYEKGFSKIDKVLSHAAKNYNLEAALYRHRALKYWQQIAASFIEESGSLTKAVDFKKGVLTVACLTREVAAQIKLMAGRILESLNQIIGRKIVFAIELAV